MRRALSLLVIAACAPVAASPNAAVVAIGVNGRTASEILTAEDRFPAGPGVPHVFEDLYRVFFDPKFSDTNTTYEERVKMERVSLGVEGELVREPEGTGFVAVNGASKIGPYRCDEFVIAKNAPYFEARPADSARCGLPYVFNPGHPYTGRAPQRTVARMRQLLESNRKVSGGKDDPKALEELFGPPAPHENDPTWFAIGPRRADAPISCWALVVTGATATIAEHPLAACGYDWPPPKTAFERRPPGPSLDRATTLAACFCNAGDVCVVDEGLPLGATVWIDPDGRHARYPDGTPAPSNLTTTCKPAP